MDSFPLWVALLFFVIAAAYATVGLGGGSAYAAALVTLGAPYAAIPQVALACNILVAGGGIWHFGRAGHVSFRACLPLLLASVPAAYLGGRLHVGPTAFEFALGGALLIAGVRMLASPGQGLRPGGRLRLWIAGLSIGGIVGFISGLVGIGGGILLGAVLVLSRWMDARTAAGTMAVFTFANSVAGFAGHIQRGFVLGASAVPLIVAAVVGGQLGSRLGARRLPTHRLRQLLALFLLIVALRTLWEAIHP
ncbi:MAG TPA: sulfite exporter TauE/SafE family protein [Candidatus Krumholzibacteria bacterium]|nr:sulfite exporter TauE/SafE family protein [Candidatus Krumholzibacteria bacterium]